MRADVVIAGGGLAGSALALQLRRRGVDAVAFERGTFPKPKVCGAVLSPGALACLEELGSLEVLRAGPVRELRRVELRCGETQTAFPLPLPALACGRERLDMLLARRAGVVEGHAVGRVVCDGRGFRVEVTHGRGQRDMLDCRVVVDASGRSSRLSGVSGKGQLFGVSFPERRDPGDVLEFGFFPWGYGGTVGLGDGSSNSAFLVTRDALGPFLARPGRRVTGPIAYRRSPPRWLSIGDAAGMTDPFSGEGMHRALASARVAADAIVLGLAAGWRYETIREAARARTPEPDFLAGLVRTRLLASRFASRLARSGLPALLMDFWWRGPDATAA